MNNVLFKKRTFVAMPFYLDIYADGSIYDHHFYQVKVKRGREVGEDLITLELEQQQQLAGRVPSKSGSKLRPLGSREKRCSGE